MTRCHKQTLNDWILIHNDLVSEKLHRQDENVLDPSDRGSHICVLNSLLLIQAGIFSKTDAFTQEISAPVYVHLKTHWATQIMHQKFVLWHLSLDQNTYTNSQRWDIASHMAIYNQSEYFISSFLR